MSNIDFNSVVIDKWPIHNLDAIYNIINFVEEKLKETSNLILVLLESNQDYYIDEIENKSLQIK